MRGRALHAWLSSAAVAHFLLVHGSWHGAWCWERAIPAIEACGHRTSAIDLPAHGADPLPAWRASLARYGARIAEAASALPEAPLLVGHSMGGLAITEAAGRAGARCAGLVYLCAFVPAQGQSLMSLGREDAATLVPSSVRLSWRGPVIRPDRAKRVFYGRCNDADAAWASAQLRPDPWRPLFESPGAALPARLPRAYVECTEDRAISLVRQRAMHEAAGIGAIETLDTDHSPFLSAPDALAAALDRLAARIVRTD